MPPRRAWACYSDWSVCQEKFQPHEGGAHGRRLCPNTGHSATAWSSGLTQASVLGSDFPRENVLIHTRSFGQLRPRSKKGVRVDGQEFPKPARSPEYASGYRVGGLRGRVLRMGPRSGFRLLWTLELGRFRAAGLAVGHLLFRGDRRGWGRPRDPELGDGRFLALQAPQGRSARRRGARPARRERPRAGDRRLVGRGLLQRDSQDLS